MNQEIKERWVAALRSREYQQGEGALCRTREDGTEEFCCLGVLCEIAVAEGIIVKMKHPDPGKHTWNYGRQGSSGSGGYLPLTVAAWSGLDDTDPVIMLDGMSTILSVANDVEKVDFPGIAQLIEEQL